MVLIELAMLPIAIAGVKVLVHIANRPQRPARPVTLDSRCFKSLHKAVDNTKKLKNEISSNPNLLNLVKQYLQINIDNNHFLTGKIKDYLRKARESNRLVLDAVSLLEEGHGRHAALEKFREIKEIGNPLTKEFIEEFNLVGERLNSTLNALRQLKEKLDQKLLSTSTWRMACRIALSVAFTAMSICSYIAVFVAPIFLDATAADKVMETLKERGDWILWDLVQSALKKKKKEEVIEYLEKGTLTAIDDFNYIRDLLLDHELENKINSTIRAAELAIEEGEEAALKAGAMQSMQTVEDLENQVERHAAELNTAISKLQKLTNSIYKYAW